MNINYKDVWEQLSELFVKYISVPALIAIFIKISVQVKNKQGTILGFFVSLFVGLGTAYLTKGAITELFDKDGVRTIITALIAILSDKICEYLVFKANVDKFLDTIFKTILEWIKAKFRK